MSNFITPTIIQGSNRFNALNAFYIGFSGSGNRFTKCSIRISDIDNNTVVGFLENQNIVTGVLNIEDYIVSSDITTPTMVDSGNVDYYLIIPQNYCENGIRYSLEVSFIGKSVPYPTDIYLFSCHSDPILSLEYYSYQNGDIVTVPPTSNSITITKSICTLHYSYSQNDGDDLKCYWFVLMNSNGDIIGQTSKIYSSTNILYGVENYNNLQSYILRLVCVTQSDNQKTLDININTDYDQDNIYANISFNFNESNALNNIFVNITELNGKGVNYTYDDDNERIIINDDGYVNFIDTYKVISSNFLCRLWCKDLSIGKIIFTIKNEKDSGYIEVYFDGNRFRAKKYNNGITTSYISNYLNISLSDLPNYNIYFAMGYYNGRIEMYTSASHI